MMKVLLLVLLAVVAVNAQFPYDDDDQVTKVLIDDFSVGGNVNEAIVTLSADLFLGQPSVIVDDTFTQAGCTGLIGCSRDLRMEATSGFSGRSFDSEIFLVSGGYFVGEWAVANPKTSSSIATIQYDGPDGSFANLAANGLGNLDVTAGGETTTLKYSIISDLDTTYTMTLRDVNGQTCTTSVFSPALSGSYSYFDTFVEVPFPSGFSGNCDFTNIGNIEVSLPSNDAVDAIVRTIQFTGPPPPSASPTPTGTRTPTPGPSNSQTPTRAPSNSPTSTPTPTRTPTGTPSPSGPCITVCVCPVFTCQLAFDLDDDVNTLSLGYSSAYADDDNDVTTVFVYVPDVTVTTVFVYVDDDDGYTTFTFTYFTTFSTFFSSFTSLFSTFTFTGFTSFYTSFFSSFTSFTTFPTSFFTSFTSFSTDFSFGGSSSSSDASTLAASAVLVAVLAVIA